MGLLGGTGSNRRSWADHAGGGFPVSAPAGGSAGLTERVVITLSGVRQPIVAILLLISFFTVLSGKPVDGLLLFTVACALAWDAGMRSRQAAPGTRARAPGQDRAVPAPEGHGELVRVESAEPAPRSVWRLRTGRPPARYLVLGVAGAAVYSLTFGSFPRYTWPTTFGVVGLGASVVIIGWGGPIRQREIPGKFGKSAALTWGTLLVVAGLWELGALLGQPNIDTGSYAHPTISTLADPLFTTSLGRSTVMMAWIGLGYFLVER